MTQKTLETSRLRLLPLTQDHAPLTVLLDTNPDVMRYIGYGKPLDLDTAHEVHKYLLATNAHIPSSGQGCWVGFVGDDFIGWWILAPAPETEDPEKFNPTRSEFGYRLLPQFWRKGYAKEGALEVLRHAFQDLGLQEVFGETMAVNEGSRKIMEKCGLTHKDTFFNKYDNPPEGIEEGEVRYVITKEEWVAAN